MKCTIFLLVIAIAAVVAFEISELKSDVEPIHSIVTRATLGCNTDSCTKLCVKQGHARGVCIGSYCQCRFRKRRSISQIEPQHLEPAYANAIPEPKHSIVTRDARRCGTEECSAHCRKLGHVRGVCIGSLCQCRSLKKRSIPNTEVQIPERKHSIVTRASCEPSGCDAFCKKLGHKRGVCVGYCQCRSI